MAAHLKPLSTSLYYSAGLGPWKNQQNHTPNSIQQELASALTPPKDSVDSYGNEQAKIKSIVRQLNLEFKHELLNSLNVQKTWAQALYEDAEAYQQRMNAIDDLLKNLQQNPETRYLELRTGDCYDCSRRFEEKLETYCPAAVKQTKRIDIGSIIGTKAGVMGHGVVLFQMKSGQWYLADLTMEQFFKRDGTMKHADWERPFLKNKPVMSQLFENGFVPLTQSIWAHYLAEITTQPDGNHWANTVAEIYQQKPLPAIVLKGIRLLGNLAKSRYADIYKNYKHSIETAGSLEAYIQGLPASIF